MKTIFIAFTFLIMGCSFQSNSNNYTQEEIDYITGRHRFKSTRSSLTSNVIQEARGISLLEIEFREQESGDFKVQFRNIPLSK